MELTRLRSIRQVGVDRINCAFLEFFRANSEFSDVLSGLEKMIDPVNAFMDQDWVSNSLNAKPLDLGLEPVNTTWKRAKDEDNSLAHIVSSIRSQMP